jgi:hypothetical protein
VTRKGPSKPVDRAFGERRRQMAKAYLKAAQDEAALADEGAIGNPIVSQIVNAAIAYTDALTAKFSDRINQQDHAGAVKALRDALGERLLDTQAKRLRRILGEKDPAQYGVRFHRKSDALRLLADVEEFARWAESELVRRR